MLEPAIPPHLQRERTQPSKLPPDYTPPFPAYCARFPSSAKDLVVAVIGAQFDHRADADNSPTLSTLAGFLLPRPSHDTTDNSAAAARPSFSELAAVTDNRGFYNTYQRWAATNGFQAWWDDLDQEEEQGDGKGEENNTQQHHPPPHGWFREIFFPTMDRFETVFSNADVPEGAAYMREAVSGPVSEHVYWGSTRHRLPAAQADALVGEKAKNLTVIRSGQDWLDTYPEERELYLGTMHPVLEKGMEYLRDHGGEFGCYSCHFMDIVDEATLRLDKMDRTFGLAYFDDLASLERWSREHVTHLDIFGGFLKYAKKLNDNITLRLFHEVLVLQPEQQLFEYIGCHEGSGGRGCCCL
ncbi:hem-containing dehydratase protein [Phialemonium atrogriseum]|uniref:Hem-containing dehydratase protein n=1 Tax=Phialemonium atrogriseum TaxID=1093897 RepID=A0AAJ0FBC6_9PEZI|nr:hem-containing dehydratase protein [Phialemonium atrogriseum]KAK1762311.1 hem-containing dehydratase protein [Phialemonium atrogriseum]